jgi:hypothetical protein
MSLQKTNLVIQAAQIPATFRGTPNDLATTMVRRMQIVSPSGTAFIFTGDTEPTSNVGPWLKDGTKWYVWDESTKRYVPQDITDSQVDWYWLGASTPTIAPPYVWLRTTKDAAEADPTVGDPMGWMLYNGSAWVPFNSVVRSGNTAQRPVTPANYQQYYDTDISCLIWWERGMWRTVAGVPGDIKAVAFNTLVDALLYNPGWEVLGASDAGIRGRYLSQAAQDAVGSGGTTVLSVGSGITARAAFETFGEATKLKIDNTVTGVVPPGGIAVWHLVKL